MDYKIVRDNAKIFICEKCNFKCFKQSNFDKHLLTEKHKRITTDYKKMPKNAEEYYCDCGKIYKYRQGLYKHKKKCSRINNSIIVQDNISHNSSFMNLISQNKELMNLLVVQKEETKELIEQNKEMQKQNKEMQQTIKEIVPRIGNTTNNNNNNFNLQVFLNEDCKDALNFSEFINKIQVSFEDLENQAEIGYINGISKLFIENLQELGTHKRPIHCTDKKRKTLYIKENNEWDKEDSQNTLKKGIRSVSRKTQDCLSQEKEENLEEYEDIESDFSQKYLSIRRSLLPGFPQETTINKVIEKISQNSGIIE